MTFRFTCLISGTLCKIPSAKALGSGELRVFVVAFKGGECVGVSRRLHVGCRCVTLNVCARLAGKF